MSIKLNTTQSNTMQKKTTQPKHSIPGAWQQITAITITCGRIMTAQNAIFENHYLILTYSWVAEGEREKGRKEEGRWERERNEEDVWLGGKRVGWGR